LITGANDIKKAQALVGDITEEDLIYVDYFVNPILPGLLKRKPAWLLWSGKGAFRRFKDAIIQHDVENEWYDFKFNQSGFSSACSA